QERENQPTHIEGHEAHRSLPSSRFGLVAPGVWSAAVARSLIALVRALPLGDGRASISIVRAIVLCMVFVASCSSSSGDATPAPPGGDDTSGDDGGAGDDGGGTNPPPPGSDGGGAAVDPPLGGSSKGSGGAAPVNGATASASGITYRLIVPS